MKTIRLRNIRSFTDTTEIPISPITVLLGQNSSGKSTFLRTLPLLKQSLGVRTQGPFLWLGQLVDFGSFDETLSKFATEPFVSIEFQLEFDFYSALQLRSIFRQRYNTPLQSVPVTVAVTEIQGQNQEKNSFQYEFKVGPDAVKFRVSDLGKFTFMSINGNEYTHFVKDRLEIKGWTGPIPNFGVIAGQNRVLPSEDVPSFSGELIKFLKRRSHGKTGAERIQDLGQMLTTQPLEQLLFSAKRLWAGDSQWKKHTAEWTQDSVDYQKLRELVVGARFPQMVAILSEYIAQFLYNTRYIKPLRASAERYYRKQGLAVDEIDPQGDNFALFLHNMKESEKQSFIDWCEKFFGLWIDVRELGGHLSLILSSRDEPTQSFNMADTGFGFSQMFPILAQLWSIRRPRSGKVGTAGADIPFVFSIEQPELHLHPRLQAKLADVFVSAIKAAREIGIDLRLLVETHSEYFVNRLGYLISKNELDSSDVAVPIFEKDNPGATTEVRKATFSEKGFLQNWPFGFFEPSI